MKRTKFPTDADKNKALIKEAIGLVKPLVHKIESGPELTQHHYSTYLAVLSESKDPLEIHKLAAVLIMAGANVNGVRTALKLLKGHPL